MAKIREIYMVEDALKEYSTEEVIHFIRRCIDNYANMVNDIPERLSFNLIQEVVAGLDAKLNGQQSVNLL